jgi:ubiquitin thioesterase protein OTUB1
MNAVREFNVLFVVVPAQSTVLITMNDVNPAASSYLVTFMRMITSTQIQSEPETYEPFLIHPDNGETMGVREFCKVVVEVLGKEAGEHSPFSSTYALLILEPFLYIDHVQLMAISQALKVNLKIAYLDGRSQDGRVEFVTFNHASDQNETPLTLLYR